MTDETFDELQAQAKASLLADHPNPREPLTRVNADTPRVEDHRNHAETP
ncbi:hypothetical protein [Planotetraspora phitsanulokensis]